MEDNEKSLAQQLKDAGCPRVPQLHSGVYTLPDLSDLIQACGDKFWRLENWREDGWKAFDPHLNQSEGKGRNPEEAVARLWLALNKK